MWAQCLKEDDDDCDLYCYYVVWYWKKFVIWELWKWTESQNTQKSNGKTGVDDQQTGKELSESGIYKDKRPVSYTHLGLLIHTSNEDKLIFMA